MSSFLARARARLSLTVEQARDIAERAAWTGVEAFGATLVPVVWASVKVDDFDPAVVQAAAIAAVPGALGAAFAAIKGYLFTRSGDLTASSNRPLTPPLSEFDFVPVRDGDA